MEEAFVVFGDEVGGGIEDKRAFGSSSLSKFANDPLSLPHLLVVIIPVLNGANGRLTLKYFVSQYIILLVDLNLGFFLLNSQMAFWYKCMVVASVSMLLNLGLLVAHNISESVD